MMERGKEKEERREGEKGGRREDIYFITSWVTQLHTTPAYLNQFEQVFKELVVIHCDPSPFISPNTIMFHLVFITLYTCICENMEVQGRWGKEGEMGEEEEEVEEEMRRGREEEGEG